MNMPKILRCSESQLVILSGAPEGRVVEGRANYLVILSPSFFVIRPSTTRPAGAPLGMTRYGSG